MAWEIEVTDQFKQWWDGFTIDQQAAVSVRVAARRRAVPRLVGRRWSGSGHRVITT